MTTKNAKNTEKPASPPLPAPPGSVWIVTWHDQNGQPSGIHGVFAAERAARKCAETMNRASQGAVYRATQWTVTPNAERSHAGPMMPDAPRDDLPALAAAIGWPLCAARLSLASDLRVLALQGIQKLWIAIAKLPDVESNFSIRVLVRCDIDETACGCVGNAGSRRVNLVHERHFLGTLPVPLERPDDRRPKVVRCEPAWPLVLPTIFVDAGQEELFAVNRVVFFQPSSTPAALWRLAAQQAEEHYCRGDSLKWARTNTHGQRRRSGSAGQARPVWNRAGIPRLPVAPLLAVGLGFVVIRKEVPHPRRGVLGGEHNLLRHKIVVLASYPCVVPVQLGPVDCPSSLKCTQRAVEAIADDVHKLAGNFLVAGVLHTL
jgi:hypothetical protein